MGNCKTNVSCDEWRLCEYMLHVCVYVGLYIRNDIIVSWCLVCGVLPEFFLKLLRNRKNGRAYQNSTICTWSVGVSVFEITHFIWCARFFIFESVLRKNAKNI